MKKWFKECPFCKNEIKEKAIKCQYCWEFLNKDEKESSGAKYQWVRYKNKRFWIILWIVVVLFLIIYISSLWKQARVNHLVDKTMDRIENHKTYEELREELDNVKTTPERETAYEEMWELVDNFVAKIGSVDEEFLYIDANDYKNKSKIQKSIDSRKLYDKYFRDYANDCDALFKKYKDIDDTWNWKYSLSGMSKEILKLADSVSNYKDKNVSFYNYILTIQDDFYVDNDWWVIFYDGWSKMDKYNQLSSELTNAAIKFLKDYNSYMDYNDQYNRYWDFD